MSALNTPEERRAYSKGYAAGRRRTAGEVASDQGRGASAEALFVYLVDGLILQGLSLDEILDAQLIGAKGAR